MPLNPAATRVELPPLAPDAPDVTAVIVNYNTRELVLAAVRSLKAHADDVRLEIVVVDNASSDGSAAALREAFPDVTVIDAPNLGFAAGNNRGFEAAHGRYLLLFNPDAEATPGLLRASLDAMEEDPSIGALGCRVVHPDGSTDPSVFRFPRLSHVLWNVLVPGSAMARSRMFGDVRYAEADLDAPLDVDVVAGCYILVPREVVAEVGGLDERFFMYSEETEWCWRIRRSGRRVLYAPVGTVVHYGGASTDGVSPWSAVETAKGQILFFRITRGDAAARLVTALMLVRDGMRRVVLEVLAPLVPGVRKSLPLLRARTRFLTQAVRSPPLGQATSRGSHGV